MNLAIGRICATEIKKRVPGINFTRSHRSGVYIYDVQVFVGFWSRRRRLSALTESQGKYLKGFNFMRDARINRPLCLGDLILAVSSNSDSQEETAATVADLLLREVTLMNNGRQVRARGSYFT